MTIPKTLSIIGAGKLGQALGRLWQTAEFIQLQQVLNRSIDSAGQAVAFIGAGQAIANFIDLQPADIYLIATPDDQISACCEKLALTGLLKPCSIVFHCSGALPSAALQSARAQGAAIASIHPVRSFALPQQVAENFSGTWCGVEGDAAALQVLTPAFSAIGAQLVSIDAEAKALYHAAAVLASNYLVSLLDVAQQTYGKAGIAPEVALQLMGPLVRETVENVLRAGPQAALTGPLARGDMATVEKQFQALTNANPMHAALYQQFIPLTLELAARRHQQD